MPRNTVEQFWPKVGMGPNGCWVWLGHKTARGYGMWKYEGSNYAHVAAYRIQVGEVPHGWQVDHLCKNTSCVRKDHLEAVTPDENLDRAVAHKRAATHCKWGHPLSGENLRIWPKPNGRPQRMCVLCGRRRSREHYLRTRGGVHGV